MFIESNVIDTSRRTDVKGEENYLHSLGFSDEEHFLAWLGDDMVLDLGSGYGTLSKNVAKKKRKAQVVSLNPSLANEAFMAAARAKTRELVDTDDPEEIAFLNDAHDSLAVSDKWDKLRFSDESFSKIITSYAFPMYCKTRQELQATVAEMKRVLKPGGEIRINAPKSNSITDKKGVVIPRDRFYVGFKKILENEGFVVSELAEYDPEIEKALGPLGGGRLQTVDKPFFLSIRKPAASAFATAASRHDESPIYMPDDFSNN